MEVRIREVGVYIHFVKFSRQAMQTVAFMEFLCRNSNFERDFDCNLSRFDL